MNLEELNSLTTGDIADKWSDVVKTYATEDKDRYENIDKYIKEYDLQHYVLENPDRADAIIGSGNNKRVVKKAKLLISFQKKITNLAVAFLFGRPVRLIVDKRSETFDEELAGLKIIQDIWRSAKLNYHDRQLARRLFIETHVAELFYVVKTPEEGNKIKVMLLSRENGDILVPHFDKYGDFDVFARKYKVLDDEGKENEAIDIYTAQTIIKAIKLDDWQFTIDQNLVGKIPVIYYSQDAAEWTDVQTLIDRLEDMISKNADTNDYFGSPSVKVKGKISNPPGKEIQGKMFQLEGQNVEGRIEYGDLSYLTWDHAPEAIKLEYEILKDLIYSQTSTPDISFNNLKDIGNMSGIAMRFMFLDAALKSLNKQEIFGEGLARRINLLKEMVSKVADVRSAKQLNGLDVEIQFQDALPEAVRETIEMLNIATGGEKIMSTKTALQHNPLVQNTEGEMEELNRESENPNETFIP